MAKTLIYQLYPLAWKGLPEMTRHIPRIAALGADYVWLSPIFPSPFKDGGYDVSNYKAISPTFGTMEDFDEFVATAHAFGVKVLLDLVLNHTSIEHRWFRKKPEYYYWELPASPLDRDHPPHPRWRNLFNGGPAWAYDKEMDLYYLHMFHETQADLDWFPNNQLNQNLVDEFRKIVDFWTDEHGVDGFRLDATQVINKDVKTPEFKPIETANRYIYKAPEVISAIFNKSRRDLYLLVECLDLSGGMLDYYYRHAPVNAIMDNTPINTLAITADQSITERSLDDYIGAVQRAEKSCPEGFAHVTESHDGPRFASATGVDSLTALEILFGTYQGERFCNPQTIVMYQGQELGLKNPTKRRLPDELMIRLDAQTAMRYVKGEELDDLRPTSRANSRIPIPMGQYNSQESSTDSYLSLTKTLARQWRRA